MPPLISGNRILRRRLPEQHTLQPQSKQQPKPKNPYKNTPYGEKLVAAAKMVPGMLTGDLQALFHQLVTTPEFTATLVAVAGVFAALQLTLAGPAIDALFVVVFGLKAGIELVKFFYQGFQAKDEAGIKAAAESFKKAVEDGEPTLISELAGGLKNLTGLLKKLQGCRNASPTAAATRQKTQSTYFFHRSGKLATA